MKILVFALFLMHLVPVHGQTDEQSAIAFIKKETIDGSLDFNKKLKEQGKTGFLLFDGVAYNTEDFAILLWGKAIKKLGVDSVKKAIMLWEEIHNKTLTKADIKALKKGMKT